MFTTKMVSFMKHTKDRMTNPLPVGEIKQLVSLAKTLGATHCEVATVIGHANFAAHSKLWADEIHAGGLKVTWRCAHQNMEGLYGATKFVGPARKPSQFWIDEAVNALKTLPILAGDELAIYPERTEGIFQDSTSFLPQTGLPGTYADFFISLHNAIKAAVPVGVSIGLSANNASELLSGWMPRSLSDYAGVVVIDHYVDGNPAKYEQDVRAINTKYGKPVYVQEGAANRFTAPTAGQAAAYYAVNKTLADEGILAGYGAWGGWAGTPEALLAVSSGVWNLNDQGRALKDWWLPLVDLPVALKSMEVLRQATRITFGGSSDQTKIAALQELLTPTIE